MNTILDKIRTYKLADVASRKAERPQEAIEAAARNAPPVRPFARALADASRQAYGLIAEIKKASPSRGVIRKDFDPASLARDFAEGGATCLSVLTDTPSFQGADRYLVAARGATNLPVLRKDFLHDPWQVAEARSLGADGILIIMAHVSDAQAAELEAEAFRWNMGALIEIHDMRELERAALLKSPLLGINNRNLNTFKTTLDITRELSDHVPEDRIIISESGLRTPEDLAEMARYGARCFLIGEHLMRQRDVVAATRKLLAPLSVRRER
ncbi:MAG: indole-3-glycerol phosphate synthase TrpC [Pseudomonadota bacterium]